jgi:hypothetical protein
MAVLAALEAQVLGSQLCWIRDLTAISKAMALEPTIEAVRHRQ